jgi:hypothetical protein
VAGPLILRERFGKPVDMSNNVPRVCIGWSLEVDQLKLKGVTALIFKMLSKVGTYAAPSMAAVPERKRMVQDLALDASAGISFI